MQWGNDLTDVGGRLIAEGLKGNCSVTEVNLVSLGGLLMLLLLTFAEQGFRGKSDAVNLEITQGLLERHGADKGVAIVCSGGQFFDFKSKDIEASSHGVRSLV